MLRNGILVLALLTLAQLAASQEDPQPVTKTAVCETAFTIPAQTAKTCSFDVPEGLRKVRLVGQFKATGGSGNTIEVWVMNDRQFADWQNQHSVQALYNSQKITQGSVNVFLTNPGKYHVVFNNDFSATAPKNVEANLTLRLIR